MNWQSLGGALIKAGAPIIGNALGGPLGGMIGDAIGGVLAGTLGVPATPDAVNDALRTTPAGELQAKLSAADAEAAAKWPALAEIAKAEAEAAASSLAETAATMRAEAVSGDPVQRWWRPIYAFELTLECAAFWCALVRDLFAVGDLKVINAAIAATAVLSVYWSARFAVLGVYVNGRSREKEAAVTGKLAPLDRRADRQSGAAAMTPPAGSSPHPSAPFPAGGQPQSLHLMEWHDDLRLDSLRCQRDPVRPLDGRTAERAVAMVDPHDGDGRELDYMQKELSRLTEVASKQVAHDERLRSIEQRIENLRCFENRQGDKAQMCICSLLLDFRIVLSY